MIEFVLLFSLLMTEPAEALDWADHVIEFKQPSHYLLFKGGEICWYYDEEELWCLEPQEIAALVTRLDALEKRMDKREQCSCTIDLDGYDWSDYWFVDGDGDSSSVYWFNNGRSLGDYTNVDGGNNDDS